MVQTGSKMAKDYIVTDGEGYCISFEWKPHADEYLLKEQKEGRLLNYFVEEREYESYAEKHERYESDRKIMAEFIHREWMDFDNDMAVDLLNDLGLLNDDNELIDL